MVLSCATQIPLLQSLVATTAAVTATVGAAQRSTRPVCMPDNSPAGSPAPPPSSSLWHDGCQAGGACCEDFCAGRCIFPGPVGGALAGRRQNITVTRLTPYEIDDPVDKDFGDLGGDLDFLMMANDARGAPLVCKLCAQWHSQVAQTW